MSVGGLDLVGVVIPARDEAASIAACLAAVEVARASCPVPCRVVVVLDRCVDATAALVAARANVESVTTTGPGGVGRARGRGVRHLLDAATPDPVDGPVFGLPTDPVGGLDPRRVWLAHTDADSRVPADWLQVMAAHAAAGADVVVGGVVPDVEPALLARWRAWHPADDEVHVYGCNLGVRASTYLAAGGFDGAGTGEDERLVARTSGLAGVVSVRSDGRPVTTSGRRSSRVDGGFATYLDVLGRTGSPPARTGPTGTG